MSVYLAPHLSLHCPREYTSLPREYPLLQIGMKYNIGENLPHQEGLEPRVMIIICRVYIGHDRRNYQLMLHSRLGK